MHTHAIKLIRDWRALILLALVPALTNCSKIEGSAELRSSTGEAYSFEGAKVEAFDLNPAVVLPGGTKIPKGLGSIEADDGAITLQVITATIDDDALYDVEIRCPANNTTDACNVALPLHVVLNGAQLKTGGWTATVLSEIAFQNIAYYAATAYSAEEIAQILANNANALLLALPAGVQKTYDDLIAWSAAETDAIKRTELINTISESLAAGITDSDLKVLAQQSVSAELSSFNLYDYPAIDGWIVGVQLVDGYAYLLGEDMPVTIVDIRDPNRMAPVGTVPAHIHNDPVVSGDFLYGVGSSDVYLDGELLYAFDISNRQQPQLIGQVDLPYSPSLAASGGYVYASNGDVISIIDATASAGLTVVGTLSIPNEYSQVIGDHMFITNATEISIVDVSTPSTPLVVGSMTTPRRTSSITIIGDYAYLIIPGATPGDSVQLRVVDISNPAEPTITTELTLATGTYGLTVVGTRAYADTSTTTQILDISNAAAPVLADSFPFASSGIRVSDAAFFTYTGSSIDILSIIDPSISSQPVVQSANAAIDGRTSSLSASGRYLYVPNEEMGLSVYDLIDPLAPALISSFYEGHAYNSMVISGNVAFLGDVAFGGVETADISNPAAPLLHYNNIRLDEGSEELYVIRSLFLSGNTVFVPWGHAAYDNGDGTGYGEWGCTNPNVDGGVGGLFAVDVSDLETLELASHICMPEEARAVAANGNYAYVGVADKTLRVVDFTDIAQPALIGSLDLVAPANSIALVGGYLWVAEGDGGIEIFNISAPAAPVLLIHIAVPGDTSSIEIEGNLVYVAAGLSGVHIFDIGNPMLPQLVGSVSTDLPARSAFVEGDYLYAATNTTLEIFKAFPGSL